MISCNWCASDEYVDYDEVTKVAVCTGPGHTPERMWEPAAEGKAANRLTALGDGIAADHGLYDALPGCLSIGEWAETGVRVICKVGAGCREDRASCRGLGLIGGSLPRC
jgi:hypothetical protein